MSILMIQRSIVLSVLLLVPCLMSAAQEQTQAYGEVGHIEAPEIELDRAVEDVLKTSRMMKAMDRSGSPMEDNRQLEQEDPLLDVEADEEYLDEFLQEAQREPSRPEVKGVTEKSGVNHESNGAVERRITGMLWAFVLGAAYLARSATLRT